MKKRLLSAALALAMVLTMLPLSVMPAFATNPPKPSDTTGITAAAADTCAGQTFTYRAKDYVLVKGAADGTGEIKAPMAGWYWVKPAEGSTPAAAYSAESGVFNGTSTSSNKWYGTVDAALEDGASTVKLLANVTNNCDLMKAKGTSLTIHLNGFTLALSTGTNGLNNTAANANEKTTLTSLTIKNTEKTDADEWPAVTGSITAKNQNFSYTAENTETGSTGLAITLENITTSAKTLTVSLTDAKVGAITTKKAKLSLTATSKATAGAAETGEIKVNDGIANDAIDPGASSISVTSSKLDDITWNGDGTITVNGSSEVGDITIDGGTKAGDPKALPKWGGNTTVTVNGGTVDTVTEKASTGTDGVITVNVNKGATVKEINLSNSNTAHVVKVDGGTAAGGTSSNATGIKMNAGKLDIQNGAVVGPVTLGVASKGADITANISGANTVVNGLNAATSGTTVNPTVNITGGTFTDEVNLGTAYNKKTISGGTFSTSIAANTGWLKGVTYQIADTLDSNSRYTRFTYTDSFQDCVDAAKNAPKDSNGNPVMQVKVVGATGTATFAKFIVGVGSDAETILTVVTDAATPIILPSTVNGKAVDVWYVGTTNERKTPGASVLVSNTSADTALLITTAVGAGGSEIVEVKADYNTDKNTSNSGLSALLSGTTIKVSGALRPGIGSSEPIDLLLKTADEKEQSITVYFQPNGTDGRTGKLITGSLPDPFYGNDSNTGIKVKGLDSVTYLLDGSGLVVRAGDADVSTAVGDTEATSSVSGLDAAQKADLETKLKGSTADGLVNDVAVKEAANKILAGLTPTQVDNHIKNAKIAMWRKDNNSTRTPDDSALNSYNMYTKLKVVVYLHITAKTWDKSAGSQSMQFDIEPWYNLQVTGDNLNGKEPYVIQTGRALPMSGVTADYGQIEVKLSLPTGFAPDWAHHKDYVYEVATDSQQYKFTTTHGFSPFLLNGVNPKAELKKTASSNVEYYDNVQTAVNDVEDGGTVKLRANYGKTSETFSVTGKARTFTFDVGPNGTFIPSFSGANVTTNPAVGSERIVQLSVDNFTNASITVSSNSNGTTTVSTNSARPGATVTITATPKSGYQASTPTVTTNTGATVTVSGSNGTYTFVVPAGATSITVRPNYVLSTGMPFTDVTNTSAWYFNGVKYCWDTMKNGYHLMQGYSDDEFGPSRNFTRAEMVQILYNINGRPSVTGLSNPFSDVNRTNASIAWAYDAIVWAANNGYADGDGDGRFRPSSNVSRCELVEFLWKYENKPTGSGNLNVYSDAYGVPQWAQASMRWAVGYNILSGQNSVSLGNSIAAESNALRSQVAVTMMQYYERYGG